MIAALQAAYMCAGNSFGIQVNMCKSRDLVLAAMIEKDRKTFWKTKRKVWFNVFAGPPALADEWSCDQEDRCCALWRPFGKNVDEYRSSERVADEDGARFERGNLRLQDLLPSCITGIGLVGHDRVADFITRSKLLAQAFDKLVVPVIMGAITATLNK